MIQVQCDACDRVFEVEDDLVGQKVRCPACGDVAIVGGAGEPRPVAPSQANASTTPTFPPGARSLGDQRGASVHDRAAALGLPSGAGPEREVLMVRPAMFRARPLSGLLLLAALFGGGGAGVWFLVQGQLPTGLGGLGVAAAALVVLAAWRIVKATTSLRVTTKRTIETVGLLSRQSSEILHKDIQNFTVQQTLWERLWQVGTIGISSAAEDGQEIVMRDVPDPQRVYQTIDAYRPM